MLRKLLYNSVTVSLPKNIVQFSLGVVLFWLVYAQIDVFTLTVALSGFLLAYSSIYFFNDIFDAEDDRGDHDKRGWKFVAGGIMSKRTAAAFGIAFAISGIALSALVNGWFLSIVLATLFLNFLHSSPMIRLKKNMPATAVNMTAIEFLKFSIGWFAFTGNLSLFPFWIILTFALVYSAIYIVYKFRFKGNMIKSNKWLLLSIGSITAISYFISLTAYEFALPMIMLLGIAFLLAMISMGKKVKFMSWLVVEFVILPVVIISFLLLSLPMISDVNEKITTKIDLYKEAVYNELPSSMINRLGNLEIKYESLDDVQNAILK